MSYRNTFIALLASALIFTATTSAAEDGARAELDSGHLTLHVAETAGGYSLRLSGPYEYSHESRFEAWEKPYFELYGLADGTYTWELRGIGEARDRDSAERKSLRSPAGRIFSGAFTLENGTAVDPRLPEPTEKTQHFAEDVVVEGSACIGIDCVQNENYGADTLRLKENNLRIHFEDTSASSTFASNDWRIEINSATHGGESYFSIQDATADVDIVKIKAGAPANSLYVAEGGDVGIGTATPAADLHVMSGNSPMLRLDQDGSSGFQAQTWDLVGNEGNFFIRDTSHNSAMPFSIEAGAPHHALRLNAEGEMGLGTENPARPIHIVAETAHVAFENSAGSRWNVGANPNDNFVVSRNGSGGKEIEVTTDGRIHFRQGSTTLMTLQASGEVNATGALISSGDFCAETGCGVLGSSAGQSSIESHAQDMRALGYLPAVGETTNGEEINLNQKIGGLITELELAHEYIDQLSEELKALRALVEGD